LFMCERVGVRIQRPMLNAQGGFGKPMAFQPFTGLSF
jgi:hypothetical protein